MEVGDTVRHISNSDSVPCEVIEIKDLGHGEGYERVRIQLPPQFLGLTRCYAMKELVLIKEGQVNAG